jgi:hypothetical protein
MAFRRLAQGGDLTSARAGKEVIPTLGEISQAFARVNGLMRS